jgi:membrane-associated PAP2 superfamily phosphatase
VRASPTNPDRALAGVSTPAPRLQRDLAATLIALALLAAWEASGLDLALTGVFGSASGFAWRDAWLARDVLHTGGRWLGWALLAVLVVDAVRPRFKGPRSPRSPPSPSRAERLWWLGVVLVGLVLVPLLKRFSSTSCPWDLAIFGGSAAVPYVPHGLLGVADGGPGHCFPSGHAVAAFAFFGTVFLWRPHRPRAARALLAAVLLLGTAYGVAQLARGAHHASHSLWSAWLCWTLAVVAEWLKPAAALPTTRPWPEPTTPTPSPSATGETAENPPAPPARSAGSRASSAARSGSNGAPTACTSPCSTGDAAPR